MMKNKKRGNKKSYKRHPNQTRSHTRNMRIGALIGAVKHCSGIWRDHECFSLRERLQARLIKIALGRFFRIESKGYIKRRYNKDGTEKYEAEKSDYIRREKSGENLTSPNFTSQRGRTDVIPD